MDYYYVYLKKGMKTLINLKVSQGIEKEKMSELIDKLNGLDELIENNKIYDWLPIETEISSWQHKLLYGDKYESHFVKTYYDKLDENKVEKPPKNKHIYKKSSIKKLINKWKNNIKSSTSCSFIIEGGIKKLLKRNKK